MSTRRPHSTAPRAFVGALADECTRVRVGPVRGSSPPRGLLKRRGMAVVGVACTKAKGCAWPRGYGQTPPWSTSIIEVELPLADATVASS
jgi:hypothetical protein